MKTFYKRKIITYFVLCLFSITSLTTPLVMSYSDGNNNYLLGINGTGGYFEDFTTTTYQNVSTNAYGWGLGALSNTRNFTATLLDHHISDPVIDLEVQGRKVYTGLSDITPAADLIEILDINDPSNIRLIGSSDAHYNIYSLAVDGDVLFASQDSVVQDAMVTYNITDPFDPSWTVGKGTDNLATDIEPDGHLVYYTVHNAIDGRSLRILETNSISSPGLNIIRCNWLEDKAQAVAVNGHLAYIAADNKGLYVLNVTDKYQPTELSHLSLYGNISEIIVDGRFAYIAAGEEGVYIVDVFDPTNPTLIGRVATGDFAQNLVKKGNTLYVACSGAGAAIIDVANPNRPLHVTTINPAYTYDVALYGGILVLGTENGVYTYNVGFIGNFEKDWYANTYDNFQAWDLRVIGDVAYVAAGTDGFYTLDVRNPYAPLLLDHYPSPYGELMKAIDVRGQFAYCLHDAGIYTFDISNPEYITLTRHEVGTDLEDIVMSGPIAYVAYGDPSSSGFASMNYTYSFDLGFVANNNWETNITSICVQGNLVYIGEDRGTGLSNSPYIFNKFPTIMTPDYLGTTTLNFMEQAQDIYVDGDILYIADIGYTVIFNVSDPHGAQWIGDMRYDGAFMPSSGVWGDGAFMFSAGDYGGVFMLNTTDYQSSMFMSGSNYPDANAARKVVTHGDHTYVANTSNLIILRHYKSPGATYIPGASLAQSLSVTSLAAGDKITKATLVPTIYSTFPTGMLFYMSADGGAHWELVTPSIEHIFTNTGNDLLWRADIIGPEDRSAYLYEIAIDFEYTEPPPGGFDPTSPLWLGIFIGGGVLVLAIIVVVIAVVVRKSKKAATR